MAKTETGWLINNGNVFPIVLAAGKPVIQVPADSMSGEAHFLAQRRFFSLCPHMAEGARELSEVPFLRILIPFMKALKS